MTTNSLNSTLGDIADAIRAKTGSSDTMKPTEMASEIESIETGTPQETHTYSDWIQYVADNPTYNSFDIRIDDEYLFGPVFDADLFRNIMNTSNASKYLNMNFKNLKYIPQYMINGGSSYIYPKAPSVDANPPWEVVWEFPEAVVAAGMAFAGTQSSSSNKLLSLSFPKLTTLKSSNLLYSYCNIWSIYLPKLSNATQNLGNNSTIYPSGGGLFNVYLRDVTKIGATSGINSFLRHTLTNKFVIDNSTPPSLNTYLTNYAHNDASNRFYNGSAFIYVPKSALSDYESATNWSIYYAAGAIKSIEDNGATLQGLWPELDERYAEAWAAAANS